MSGQINVIKSDGRVEPFDPEKIIGACLRAGVPFKVAEKIADRIAKKIKEVVSTKQIRKWVIKELKLLNPEWAKGFEYKDKVLVRATAAFADFEYHSVEGSRYEPFVKSKIVDSLVKETGIKKEVASEIGRDVFKFLVDNNITRVSGHLIREIVCYFLLKRGLRKAYSRYTRVGLPVYDIDQLFAKGLKENANLQFNPETIHKLLADEVIKEYSLIHLLPERIADAHLLGDIHVHDLDYFPTRPFCLSHDLRFFLRHGLKVDGTGLHTASCRPAKHPAVAILHAAKVLAASQVNCSGGQGFDHFNVFLAPYLRGLSYEQIKQLAQMFIYEMETMYVSRGGQPVFSSIGLELEMPKFIAETKAVKPGGEVGPEVYADYEEEAKKFLKAIIEVCMEGDALGKPFHFPKLEIKLREGALKGKEDELLNSIHQLAAKFGSPYFLNMAAPYMPDICVSQCCRFFLSEEGIESLEEHYLRSSAIQYVTINLPRCAYLAKGDDEKLFERIRRMMELAREALRLKHEMIEQRLRQGMLPFLSQPCDGSYYYPIDKCMHNIGFVGLNEMLKAHVGNELHESREAWHFGLKTISFMQKIAKEFSDDGYRYAVVQTPAESTAHRLAMADKKLLGKKYDVICKGKEGAYYYTNSSHVYVGANIPLWERIKIESSFHPLVQGGAIMHVFLGEETPDPNALHELTKRIGNKTLAAYWAYTKDVTYCSSCGGVFGGLKEICPNCGVGKEKLNWYSRITGYYSNVSNWNAGKVQELKERYRYMIS